jgi:hypothetical protein
MGTSVFVGGWRFGLDLGQRLYLLGGEKPTGAEQHRPGQPQYAAQQQD